jgi:hypothetical protein
VINGVINSVINTEVGDRIARASTAGPTGLSSGHFSVSPAAGHRAVGVGGDDGGRRAVGVRDHRRQYAIQPGSA